MRDDSKQQTDKFELEIQTDAHSIEFLPEPEEMKHEISPDQSAFKF